MERVFPGPTWDRLQPANEGFDLEKLQAVNSWLQDKPHGRDWRTMIIGGGYLIEAWGQNTDRHSRISQASIDKSFMPAWLCHRWTAHCKS